MPNLVCVNFTSNASYSLGTVLDSSIIYNKTNLTYVHITLVVHVLLIIMCVLCLLIIFSFLHFLKPFIRIERKVGDICSWASIQQRAVIWSGLTRWIDFSNSYHFQNIEQSHLWNWLPSLISKHLIKNYLHLKNCRSLFLNFLYQWHNMGIWVLSASITAGVLMLMNSFI